MIAYAPTKNHCILTVEKDYYIANEEGFNKEEPTEVEIFDGIAMSFCHKRWAYDAQGWECDLKAILYITDSWKWEYEQTHLLKYKL